MKEADMRIGNFFPSMNSNEPIKEGIDKPSSPDQISDYENENFPNSELIEHKKYLISGESKAMHVRTLKQSERYFRIEEMVDINRDELIDRTEMSADSLIISSVDEFNDPPLL